MSPVSRHRSGKQKGSARSGRSSKAARSGNPATKAAAAAEQKLRRLELERQMLLAERDRLVADFPYRQGVWLEPWYAGHAVALLAEASGLTTAADPAALEQATAELVADRLLVMRDDGGGSDWEITYWLAVVAAQAADDQALSDDAALTSWMLLHGLAAICPPDLAAMLLQVVDERGATAPPSPSWVPLTPRLTIEPAVRVFADRYGLRSAILVAGHRPDGPTCTYLFDVDLCGGDSTIVRSGWYPDQDAALTAWASGVGPSADVGQQGSSAAVDVLGELLPFAEDPNDVLLGEDDPRERAVALLRDRRIIADLASRLAAAGTVPIDRTTENLELAERWAAQETPRFREWCADRGVRPAPADVVEELLTEWAAYTPHRLVRACSPHRVASFAAQLAEEWADQGRLRVAWSLVEPWAEYCLEHGDLPEHLAAPVRDAARAVTREPHRVATRVVDTWKTATDETRPLGS